MIFRLRQVDFTTDGRRIARDRDIEATSLTVGRSADNAIHLPDLAVEPHHAVIEAQGGASLVVKSVGTRGFAIDGRSTQQAALDPGTGGELRFGSTTVTISRDADGAVLLEVQNLDRQREVPDAMADKAGFSLAAVMPGKRRMGWILLAAILGLFLVLPVASHFLRTPGHHSLVRGDKPWNPGPLSLAHHALTDHCEACHVRGFESVRNETCMSCHKDVHDHAAANRLAPARGGAGIGTGTLRMIGHAFGREGPGACTDCHVEHQGDRPMSPARQQFCADCHANLKDRLSDTKLGNASDFGTVHPEFRAAVVTNADTRQRTMLSLAGHPHEDNGLTFSHKIHLAPLGGVAKMAMTLGAAQGYGKALGCNDCHRTDADGVRFQPIRMERDCEACHSLVYAKAGGTFLKLRHGDVAQMQADLARAGPTAPIVTGPIVTGRARPGDYASNGLYHASFGPQLSGVTAQAMAPNGICGECHKPEMRGGKLTVKRVTLASRFMPNGWFDHAAHKQSKCADCHAASTSAASSDVLMPRVAQCRECHLGENATRPKTPSSCAMCHVYHQSKLAPPPVRTGKRREDGAAQ